MQRKSCREKSENQTSDHQLGVDWYNPRPNKFDDPSSVKEISNIGVETSVVNGRLRRPAKNPPHKCGVAALQA